MNQVVACVDRQRRSCLVVARTKSEVKIIRLNVEEGLDVEDRRATEFDAEFQPLKDYPAERAARLYVGYARQIGATRDALDYLGHVTTVTKEDITMATAKKTANTAKPKTKPAAKGSSSLKGKGPTNETAALEASVKTGTKKTDLPANSAPKVKQLPTKPANPASGSKGKGKAAPAAKGKSKEKAEPKEKGARKESASSMFQSLIMEGKLTDDAIFAKVQKAFGLDDKKRAYVSWYRNHLRKGGAKVPDAIKA